MVTIDQLLPTSIRQAAMDPLTLRAVANAANPFATLADIGGGTPALTFQEIAFGDAANLMTSSPNFIWNDTIERLFVGTGPFVGTAKVFIQSIPLAEFGLIVRSVGYSAAAIISEYASAVSEVATIANRSTITTIQDIISLEKTFNAITVGSGAAMKFVLQTGSGQITTGRYGMVLTDGTAGTSKSDHFWTTTSATDVLVERMRLTAFGVLNLGGLAGVGTRAVAANAAGDLVIGTGTFITSANIDFTACIPVINVTAVIGCSPLLLSGGGAVSDNIIYRSTSGVGTATAVAHQFTGGTNGGTILSTQYNDGQFLVGTTTRNPTSLGIVRIGQGTSTIDIGEKSAALAAIWFNQTTPSTINYAITGNATTTTLNATTTLLIAVNNITKITLTSTTQVFQVSAATSGSLQPFLFSGPASTNLTASTEVISFRINLSASVQHATGALATQRAVVIDAPTYTFVGASTITDAVTFAAAGGPIAGTNATITNNHAIRIASNNVSGAGTTTNSYGLTINAQTGATNNYVAQFLGGNTGFLTSAPNSTIHNAGSFALMYVAKTAIYTASATDYLIDCTANTFTVDLPTAVGITGRIYVIKNSTVTGTITVDGAGAETIDLLATQNVPYPSAMMIMSNGANWIII